MKLSFSLGNKAKASTVGEAPSLRKPTAFGSLDDDDSGPPESAPKASGSKRAVAPIATGLWRAGKKKNITHDPTVSQYDEVYDDMKDAQLRAKAGKEEEGKEKKVRTSIGRLW